MSKKRTTEQFKKEIYDLVGEEYTVLGEYTRSQDKILMRHNLCAREYEVRPSDFICKHSRCAKCSGVVKKNHKEFLQEVYELVGEEYTVLGEYTNAKTKVLMRHNLCAREYEVTPSDFLYNHSRCAKCSGKMKKNTEIFKQEVYELVGEEYTVLGEYTRAKDKILMRHNCKSCNNYEWEVCVNNFLKGSRCAKCFGNSIKNTEIFKQEVYELVGDEYTVLGEYTKSLDKILMRHNNDICEYNSFFMQPNCFLSGQRCPVCSKRNQGINRRKSHMQFVQEVQALVGEEYTVLGEYTNAKTKVLMRHNCEKCNNCEWEVNPQDFLNGSRCRECFGTPKKTTEEFKQEVYDLVGNEYSVLSEYEGNRVKIKMRHNCKKCNNYVFEIDAHSFLSGTRCRKCRDSKGEKTIYTFLKNENIPFKKEYRIAECKKVNPLPFDFAVFDDDGNILILIEYQGEQHYEYVTRYYKSNDEFINRIIYDSKKRAYCEYNNIPLLEIPYTEFDRIEEILTNALCT